MTGIDPPRGPDGASGVAGPSGPDRPGDVAGASEITAAAGSTAPIDELVRLASEIDAGRLDPHDAIAHLIDGSMGGLDAAAQAELRAALGDLLASDPYFADLVRQLGAAPPEAEG